MYVCRYENVIFFLFFSVSSLKFQLEGHTSIAARTVETNLTYLTSFPCSPLFKECRAVRTIEFPFCLHLFCGSRMEDNFAQLGRFLYPILNIKRISYPTIFQQNGLVPHPDFIVFKILMDRYQVFPSNFHSGQVIHHFQMFVSFSLNL